MPMSLFHHFVLSQLQKPKKQKDKLSTRWKMRKEISRKQKMKYNKLRQLATGLSVKKKEIAQ